MRGPLELRLGTLVAMKLIESCAEICVGHVAGGLSGGSRFQQRQRAGVVLALSIEQTERLLDGEDAGMRLVQRGKDGLRAVEVALVFRSHGLLKLALHLCA